MLTPIRHFQVGGWTAAGIAVFPEGFRGGLVLVDPDSGTIRPLNPAHPQAFVATMPPDADLNLTVAGPCRP